MEIPVVISKSKLLKGIRCIIASKIIKRGELIESCPLILLPLSEDKRIDETNIGNYVFEWNKKFFCMVLGYCILINHSYKPNAVYKRDYKTKRMNYYAIKIIKKNEEILINYNGHPNKKDPLDSAHIDFKN